MGTNDWELFADYAASREDTGRDFQPRFPRTGPRRSSRTAAWSLALGIAGIVLSWFTLGFPSLLAVVFGHAGFRETRDRTIRGRGMAIAGLILGYLILIPSILVFLTAVADVISSGIPASTAPVVTPWPSHS